MTIRFPIDPLMIPEEKVARRLGVSVEQLTNCRPALELRGFPPCDPDLGTTCLQAVDSWIEGTYRLHRDPSSLDPVNAMKQALETTGWQS